MVRRLGLLFAALLALLGAAPAMAIAATTAGPASGAEEVRPGFSLSRRLAGMHI